MSTNAILERLDAERRARLEAADQRVFITVQVPTTACQRLGLDPHLFNVPRLGECALTEQGMRRHLGQQGLKARHVTEGIRNGRKHITYVCEEVQPCANPPASTQSPWTQSLTVPACPRIPYAT